MPFQSSDRLAHRRRVALLLFYAAAILSAIALSVVGKMSSFRSPSSNDEHDQQINYRALTFAFAGTIVFSLAVASLQTLGFHSVSWLGIPVLMVILWSVSLILYSWRYR